ncbi:hypothetical protein ACHAWF_016000 [Thalassiosira exigua]
MSDPSEDQIGRRLDKEEAMLLDETNKRVRPGDEEGDEYVYVVSASATLYKGVVAVRSEATRAGDAAGGPADPPPPLSSLLARNGTVVVGDVSWMLDFAVIAFPKAGTSFLKDYLRAADEVYVRERELCMKRPSDVAEFVRTYHALHVGLKQPRDQKQKTVRFGVKCPGVFYRADDVHLYAKYFPKTKFIIGLRHPASWFESFYNYQSYRNVSLPPTSRLVGRCVDHRKVCTDRARFHAALARLGKTAMSDDEEMDLLLGRRREGGAASVASGPNATDGTNVRQRYQQRRHLTRTIGGLPNPVLLYELRQIHDPEASKELSTKLRDYLDLREDLPPILPYEQTKPRAIDICDEEHADVRRALVGHGADASEWMRRYFLMHPSVEVASPDTFFRFLDDWGSRMRHQPRT